MPNVWSCSFRNTVLIYSVRTVKHPHFSIPKNCGGKTYAVTYVVTQIGRSTVCVILCVMRYIWCEPNKKKSCATQLHLLQILGMCECRSLLQAVHVWIYLFTLFVHGDYVSDEIVCTKIVPPIQYRTIVNARVLFRPLQARYKKSIHVIQSTGLCTWYNSQPTIAIDTFGEPGYFDRLYRYCRVLSSGGRIS